MNQEKLSTPNSALKTLRIKTGATFEAIQAALKSSGGVIEKAEEILKNTVTNIVDRSNKEVKFYYVGVYHHHDGTKAAIVKLGSETDFVARMSVFKELANNVAMHIVGAEPKNVDELLKQEYLLSPSMTVSQAIQELEGKCKEKIRVLEFKILT
jgi:elongation factor Ts